MRTTIDAGGRIVVPKQIRDAMGLTPGQAVDVVYSAGQIVIDVVPVAAHVEMRGRVPVIVPEGDLPPLTDEIVRDTIEATRR